MNPDELMRCRLCGLELADPPWGRDGASPLYEYCPCCGVEFGYQDASPAGARSARAKWLSAGGEWATPSERPPVWVLREQVARVPQGFGDA